MHIPLALLVPLVLARPIQVHAAGGFGSVWVTQSSPTTLTINASAPDGDRYRDATSPPLFEICWKEAGAVEGACGPSGIFAGSGHVTGTSLLPYTITNLTAGQSYKIKVYRWCEKKSWGKFRNPKFRKVGTLTTSTPHASPPPLSIHMTPVGATSNSITVRLDVTGGAQIDLIRVAYKRRWLSAASLLYTGGGRSRPDTTWYQNTPFRGWYDFSPTTTIMLTIPSLRKCAQYKIVVFGFEPGEEEGILFEKIKVHTEGGCWLTFKTGVADDDEALLQDYLDSLAGTYPEGHLLEHLAASYDPDLLDEAAALAADDEPMNSDLDVVDFLHTEHPDIYDRWQLECAESSEGKDLYDYVRINDATAFEENAGSADPVNPDDLRSSQTGDWAKLMAIEEPGIVVGPVGSFPLFITSNFNLLHDTFPQSGVFDLGNKSAMACRLDPGNTYGSSVAGWTPGDSIVCSIVPPDTATISGTPSLVATLFANPAFDGVREVPTGFFPVGTDADGWTMYFGSILGTPAVGDSGPEPDLWAFDMPGDGPGRTWPGGGSEADEDRFFFPGDVVQYYLQAADSDGGNATLPADVSMVMVKNAFDPAFTVRALPSVDAVSGDVPPILVVDGTDRAGSWDRLRTALQQNGLEIGKDFDLFTLDDVSEKYAGSLGASGIHGASVDLLSGYSLLSIGSSSLDQLTLQGSAATGGHWNDFQVLSDWVDLPGDRALGTSDATLVHNAAAQGSEGTTFLQNVLGVEDIASDVRPVLGTNSPSIAPVAGSFAQHVGLGRLCPRPELIAEVGPVQPGAVAGHIFTDQNGSPLAGGVAATVLWDRDVSGDRKVAMTTSFPPSSMMSDGSPDISGVGLSAYTVFVGEMLTELGATVDWSNPSSAPTSDRPLVLRQNVPNPFNPSTQIRFRAPDRGWVSLRIYNVRGELVRVLYDGTVDAGEQRFTWDGRDSRGQRMGSGVYFCRLEGFGERRTRKMVMLQ